MKKLFCAACILIIAFSFSACKKCYHCYNACQQCTRIINGHAFSHVLCVDSFNTKAEFDAAIATDTSIGYTCTNTTPTYEFDFCSNQPGKDMYPTYFNKGKRATCDEK